MFDYLKRLSQMIEQQNRFTEQINQSLDGVYSDLMQRFGFSVAQSHKLRKSVKMAVLAAGSLPIIELPKPQSKRERNEIFEKLIDLLDNNVQTGVVDAMLSVGSR